MAKDKKYSYFKVDSRILEFNKDTLSKSELLVYLLHCRSLNQTKNQGCSLTGFTKANELLKINEGAYDKAMESLQEKNLLRYRDDVKTGMFQSKAVEVLTFPLFVKTSNTFGIDISREHQHRTYGNGDKYIQIPANVFDEGYFIAKGITVQEIYGLLWIYEHLSMTKYLGVNYEIVHGYSNTYPKGYHNYKNKVFGEGFHKAIHKKSCVEVSIYETYKIAPKVEKGFQGNMVEALNQLVGKGLLYWKPVLIGYDVEDPDITEIRHKIYKGLVRFSNDNEAEKKYLLTQPEKNEKIIWILEPKYKPETEDLEEYKKADSVYRQKSKVIYQDYDVRTSEIERRKILHDQDFKEYCMTFTDTERNDMDTELISDIFLMDECEWFDEEDEIEDEIETIKAAIEKEKDRIKQENERIQQETGKRTRKKTSDVLKAQEKQRQEAEHKLKCIRNYENKLLDTIPEWVFYNFYRSNY